jgi:hypothetical protein
MKLTDLNLCDIRSLEIWKYVEIGAPDWNRNIYLTDRQQTVCH